jgi:hypothetical protein
VTGKWASPRLEQAAAALRTPRFAEGLEELRKLRRWVQGQDEEVKVTKETYIERVREALQLQEGALEPDEYIEALEELGADIDGLLEAAHEEAAG